ncbi:MAG: peptidase S53 [Chloroflexi bacterium]|nr:MAG: peptidase S53 [Chloroflexota bacterium]
MGDAPRVELAGSERTPLPEERRVSPADPGQRVEVTVQLRRRGALPDRGKARPHLKRREIEEIAGADPEDIARVEAFAHDHGLDVVDASPARRSVVLSGPVSALESAFGTRLFLYDIDGAVHRGRQGPLTVPAEVAPAIEGIFGLDDRPQARPHFRPLLRDGRPVQAHAVAASFSPVEVARLYDFPARATGAGQCIAIVELGGGYRKADLDQYFQGLGPISPAIVSVSVDGGMNQPEGNASGPDGEVMLDIEVAGAVAPGARIAVYFAPNTDRGFLDVVSTAIHDDVRRPSAVSISWGGPESAWTGQSMSALDAVLQDAAALGVTVLCASGDAGSGDGAADGLAHTDFPASSPHVVACGGTRLTAGAGGITAEVVWNDGAAGGATGGGVSDSFDAPSWQANASVPPSANPGGRRGRGVPDVCGDADPQTGYRVLVDGQATVVGGTSAVAPLWAGLVALLNERLGRPVGFLNPELYGAVLAGGGFRDITDGGNGAYTAGPGWDACTGLGSPRGGAILAALGGSVVVGRRKAPAPPEAAWRG